MIDGKVNLDGAKLAEKRWNLAFEAVRGAARYDGSGFEAAARDQRFENPHQDLPMTGVE